MTTWTGERAIKESMVQFLDDQGKIRGCGLLVDLRHVVTCAHVVASVLPGAMPNQVHKPTEAVRVVFPYFKYATGFVGNVIVWNPLVEGPSLDLIEDIAVLELERPAPVGSVPHGFLLASDWAGRGYMIHGFPEQNPRGDWADGTFRGETVGGWVQMLSSDCADLQVDHGFSGAGVWDEQYEEFTGIMVANKRRGAQLKPVSYMIPGTLLKKAWSELPVIQRGSNSNLARFEQFCTSYRDRRVGTDDNFGGDIRLKGGPFSITNILPRQFMCHDKFVIHAIPMNASVNFPIRLDLSKLQALPDLLDKLQAWTDHYSLYKGYEDNRYSVKRKHRNVDGLLFYSSKKSDNGYSGNYIQFYTDGIVEALDAELMDRVLHSRVIPGAAVEQSVVTLVPAILLAQRTLGLVGSVWISVAILGRLESISVSYDVAVSSGPYTIGRQHLLTLTPAVVDLTDDRSTILGQLQVTFDSLAHAGGWDRSPSKYV